MAKKGQIWISAVLYMALGIIVLTIILAAGVPMIQKMKDKNVLAQTKSLFYTVDENIKAVSNEGPGSKRYLSPFEIKAGDLYVDEDSDQIRWLLKTKAKMMEPNYYLNGQSTSIPEYQEGAIYMYMNETNIVDEYFLNLKLDYSEVADIRLKSIFEGPYSGTYSVSIINTGEYNNNLPVIDFEITI